MRAVHIRISHNHDLVVAQLGNVKVLADAGAQRGHHRHQLFVAVNLVQPCLFHIQHFTPKGQNGLVGTVPSVLGGAAGGITLDDVNFAQGGVVGGAVRQLARQLAAFQPGLITGVISGLAGRLSGARSVQGLGQQRLGYRRVLLKIGHQFVIYQGADQAGNVRIAQLALGLALKLGLGKLHADDGSQPLAHIVAGELLVIFFQNIKLFAVVVKHPGQGGFEPGLVGTAVNGIYVVGKGQQGLIVAVRIAQRHLCTAVVLSSGDVDYFILNGV